MAFGKRLSHCSKFVPIQTLGPANLPFIQSTATELLNQLPMDCESLCIIAEARNNPLFSSTQLKEALIPLLPQKKIDLTHPTHVLFVTVFKSAVGMSLLPHYLSHNRKFNVIEWCKDLSNLSV